MPAPQPPTSPRSPHPHLPTTQAAVAAVRAVADAYGLDLTVTDDIGADQVARRTSAPAFAVTDPDGSLPHDATVELAGPPSVAIRLFADGDALITVEGVEFHDVPRDSVPAFLRALLDGSAHVKGRFLPPGEWLTVPLPGGETYRELILLPTPTPWLVRAARRRP
ncbi:hypothetical protein ACFPM3_33195 [Streptomyces coeruleoprunus]|uniref:Uncharacterized protein n=1 Tax=Streptomyces coeruleoprunus TaxID=285563 RepID=A0ABV9XRZ0_9ACTN